MHSNISNLVKTSNLNAKLATLAPKAELIAKQDKLLELHALDLTYFRGKSCL